MLVPVRGVAVNVGEQTGDGRYIVPGAVTHADLPLPLAWLVDGDQHADMSFRDPQVGNITSMSFVPGGVAYTGIIDDQIPEGAEAVRRMREGSAPGGNRFFTSIDPDDWAVQLVDPNGNDGAGMVILAASGVVAPDERFDWDAPLRALRRANMLVAAAGGGDPMAEGGSVVFEDAADLLVARFTRLRIRGMTMCSVSAFAGSYMELDDDLDAEAVKFSAALEDVDEATLILDDVETLAASSVKVGREAIDLSSPPREWFDDPGLRFATPLTITNEGRVLGHVAARGACHTGYANRCVTPPMGGSYDRFHVGEVLCADGSRVACGVFAWGIPHADLTLSLMDAWAHYADSRYGFSRSVVGEDEHGIWFSGALNPGVTDNDLAVLRSLSMSGDWRRDARSGRLSLVAALAVNFPGFPIPRSSSITAAGGVEVDPAEWELESPEPYFQLDGDGDVASLIACGRLAPRSLTADCADCADTTLAVRLAAAEDKIAVFERLLSPLYPAIAERLDERIER